ERGQEMRAAWPPRADLEQPPARADRPYPPLERPGPLDVLHVAVRKREPGQAVGGVAVVAHCRIAEPRRDTAAVALDDSLRILDTPWPPAPAEPPLLEPPEPPPAR